MKPCASCRLVPLWHVHVCILGLGNLTWAAECRHINIPKRGGLSIFCVAQGRAAVCHGLSTHDHGFAQGLPHAARCMRRPSATLRGSRACRHAPHRAISNASTAKSGRWPCSEGGRGLRAVLSEYCIVWAFEAMARCLAATTVGDRLRSACTTSRCPARTAVSLRRTVAEEAQLPQCHLHWHTMDTVGPEGR